MKRLNLLMAMLLMVLAGAWAQTSQRAVHRVQGIERADLTVPQVMNTIGTGIEYDDIDYWVGDGSNWAALAVKWYDNREKQRVYVWGYKWQSGTVRTGADMICSIAAEDPRFFLLVNGGTTIWDIELNDSVYAGDVIGGIGFDKYVSTNPIKLVYNNVQYPLTYGVYDCHNYNFDGWTTNAPNALWNSGWYSAGYWSYWNANSLTSNYTYAQTGCSGRTLTSGCVDGWAFAPAPGWSSDMSGTIEYVSPVINIADLSRRQAPKRVQTRGEGETVTHTLTSVENLMETVLNAADGDVIEFDESLRGQEIDCSEVGHILIEEKTITLNGNGVILKNFNGISLTNDATVFVKEVIFDSPNDYTLSVYNTSKTFGNLSVENCTFRNYYGNKNIIFVSNTIVQPKEYFVNISGCLFENNTLRNDEYEYFDKLVNLSGYKKHKHDFKATIVNNTFRGNKAINASCLNCGNYIDVELVNNVFENNKNTAEGGVDINIKEDRVFLNTSAYNVISGTINEGYQEQLSETDKWAVDLETSLENVDGQWQVKKDSPAYHNVPAEAIVFDEDGCPTLMGVKLPTTDIYGNAIDYTKPTQAGCSQAVVGGDVEEPQAIDYTQGTFLLNEDWYGHQNSTINFLTEEGEMIYRVIQRENEGVQLGCTAQYGTIYGGKMYITSKQEKDPGAKVTGGRLTICDARTMKVEKQFQTITANGYKGKADGRAFLGVNEHKGYMGTSNGIFILDLDELEFTDFIKVPNDDEDLYTGQVGNMVRAGDYVFANHQNAGLLVIDPETDQIVKALKPNDALVSTMTLANDGNLWLMSGGKLVKLDPYSLEMETIELPSNVRTTSEGWGAWRASTFCASRQQNALFWVSADGALEDKGDVIFKYDIDKGEVSHYLQLPEAEEWSIYGSGFRIDPVTDEAIMCLFKTYGNNSYITRKYNAQGEKILELEMEKNYWFPALPIYPDNAAPVVTPLDAQTVALGETAEVSLADLATDADNMTASIIKTVKAVSDADVLSASIKGGKLLLEGLAEGTATVTIQVNSNGQLAETSVEVTVAEPAEELDYDLAILSFEDADYKGDGNMLGNKDWSSIIDSPQYNGDLLYDDENPYWWFDENNTGLSSTLNDPWEIGAQFWYGGTAISNYVTTDFTGASYSQQLTAYNPDGGKGGHNNSDNFLVCYGYTDTAYGMVSCPVLTFADGEAKVIDHLYLALNAYTLNSLTNGDGFCAASKPGDYVNVVFEGLDADDEVVGRVTVPVTNALGRPMTDYAKVDLSTLGEIVSLRLDMESSITNKDGMSVPAYYILDDIAVRVAKGEPSNPDSIVTISTPAAPAAIYTLDGQRVNSITRPGLYIMGGRKVVVK